MFIGSLGRIVGGPFGALALVTTVMTVAAMLLLYALSVRLTASRVAAVALIPIVLFAIHALNHADGILPLRQPEILSSLLTIDPEDQVHAWSRFPAPVLVLAPFFLAVLALPRAVEDGSRGWMAATAIAIALLIYSYVYYWTALAVALAAWFVVLLLRGERDEALRLLAVGAGGVLLALPELVTVGWSVLSLPADARDRVGLDPAGIDTSLATTIAQRLLVGAPFLAALWVRRSASNLLYGALFLAPLFLAPLQGIVPQQWHYQTQVWGVFAIPAVIAGGAIIASSIRWPEVRRVAYAIGVALAAVSALYVVALQVRAVSSSADGYVLTSDEDAAFAWMRDHLGEDDTVVSSSVTTNLLLASLTPTSQYLADGGFTYAEDDELISRLLRVQAAYGYSEDDMLRRVDIGDEHDGFPLNDPDPGIREQERMLEDHLAFFTFSFEIEDRDAFMARSESWRPQYRALLSTDDPLSAYPADYVYCGHRERFYDAASASPGTFVRVAFEQGDVTVFEHVAPGAEGATEFRGCSS
jgi:hypothetical protein